MAPILSSDELRASQGRLRDVGARTGGLARAGVVEEARP